MWWEGSELWWLSATTSNLHKSQYIYFYDTIISYNMILIVCVVNFYSSPYCVLMPQIHFSQETEFVSFRWVKCSVFRMILVILISHSVCVPDFCSSVQNSRTDREAAVQQWGEAGRSGCQRQPSTGGGALSLWQRHRWEHHACGGQPRLDNRWCFYLFIKSSFVTLVVFSSRL